MSALLYCDECKEYHVWGEHNYAGPKAEQLPSNPPCDPVVWRFICAVFPDAPHLALASFNEKHALTTAAETIERLTAELQGTKDELHSVDKAAKELGAERDRLLDGARKIDLVLVNYRDEVARLRAALELAKTRAIAIVQDYVSASAMQVCAGKIIKIVDEALAGSQAIPCESAQESRAQPVETAATPCEHDWTPWGMPGPASHCRKCGKWAEWPQVNGDGCS